LSAQNNMKNVALTRLLFAFAFLSWIAVSVGAQQPRRSEPVSEKLTIAGSSLLVPLMTDIATRFEALHPGSKIEIRARGVEKGLVEVRSGTANAVMVPRNLRAVERDLFSFPIARDGVAVVVHRDNPVKDIDSRQFSEILTGKLTNWKVLGGRDAPVHLAWRTGQGSTEFILEYLRLRREQIVGYTTIETNDEAIRFTASDLNGVALASVGQAERMARTNVPIKLLSFNGFPAASRTIQNHTYALSRPLMLITSRVPDALQKQFIDYAGSTSVIDLQLKYGFVPYQE
jgi:phosphate transport system substrate-binding protein